MKKILLIAVYLLINFNCYANSNWIYVAKSMDDENNFFIDINSTQKQGDSITFWILNNYKERDKFGDLSSKVQQTINCRTREIIHRYFFYYDDINNNGRLTNSNGLSSSWYPISPDSVNWTIFKFICK